MRLLSHQLQVDFEWLVVGKERSENDSSAATLRSRHHLESRMLHLSKHVPVSFLATVIALLESACACLE